MWVVIKGEHILEVLTADVSKRNRRCLRTRICTWKLRLSVGGDFRVEPGYVLSLSWILTQTWSESEACDVCCPYEFFSNIYISTIHIDHYVPCTWHVLIAGGWLILGQAIAIHCPIGQFDMSSALSKWTWIYWKVSWIQMFDSWFWYSIRFVDVAMDTSWVVHDTLLVFLQLWRSSALPFWFRCYSRWHKWFPLGTGCITSRWHISMTCEYQRRSFNQQRYNQAYFQWRQNVMSMLHWDTIFAII